MNRRERRSTAKRLGILKYQKSLPRKERFELMRENVIAGRKKHEEFVETATITREEAEANELAYKLNVRAIRLAQRTGKMLDDALDIVTKEHQEKIKNKK